MFDAYVLRADEIPDDLRAVIPYWRAEGGEFWAGPPQSGQEPVTGGVTRVVWLCQPPKGPAALFGWGAVVTRWASTDRSYRLLG